MMYAQHKLAFFVEDVNYTQPNQIFCCMKKRFLLPSLLLCYASLHAQIDSIYHTQNVNAFHILGGIGLSHEHSLGKNTTLFLGGSFASSFTSRMTTVRGQSNLDFLFGLGIEAKTQLRRYYNLQKRRRNGKPVAFNTGSYVALQGIYEHPGLITAPKDFNSRFLVGPVWGVQVVRKKLFLNVNIGAMGNFPLSGPPLEGIVAWPVLPHTHLALGFFLRPRTRIPVGN
jgi:hypothetical protein